MPIHPTALISTEADIHPQANIGAYVIIEGPVRISEGCHIAPHAQIIGDTWIGKNTSIGRGAIVGENPQDLGFKTETASGVRIGEENTLREYMTIHRGSKDGSHTTMGNGNFLMAGVHLGHDVILGDRNIIANDALLAGHVHVGNGTFIGGAAVFHQFLRIGDGCVIQGNGSFSKDIPHFCAAQRINRVTGLNVIGLRRQGLTTQQRASIKAIFDLLYRSGKNFSQAIEVARQQTWIEHAERFLQFFEAPSKKGICPWRSGADDE